MFNFYAHQNFVLTRKLNDLSKWKHYEKVLAIDHIHENNISIVDISRFLFFNKIELRQGQKLLMEFRCLTFFDIAFKSYILKRYKGNIAGQAKQGTGKQLTRTSANFYKRCSLFLPQIICNRCRHVNRKECSKTASIQQRTQLSDTNSDDDFQHQEPVQT